MIGFALWFLQANNQGYVNSLSLQKIYAVAKLYVYLQFPPRNLCMLNEIEISGYIREHMKHICRIKKEI